MKKKLRRTLAIVLAAIMLISVFPVVNAFATKKGKCGDNVQWRLDTNGTLTVSGSGRMYDYAYKGEGMDLDFVEYGSDTPWVQSREKIKKIVIRGDVTYIGQHAFAGFTALKSVNISAKVKMIGRNAFEYSKSLELVKLPEGIETIGDSAFLCCISLLSINLPDGLKTIEHSAFSFCQKLNNVKLPDSLTTIGDSAFKHCRSFTEVQLPKKITKIEDEAFGWCPKLKTISIPNGVKSIGDRAFACDTSLENITLPEKLEKIGVVAFVECFKLKSIRIPKSVKKIDECAFGYYWDEDAPMEDQCVLIGNDFVIYGCKGSAAQKYAKKNNIKFKTLGEVAKVYLSKSSLVYNGKVQKPTVVAKDTKGNKLKLGTDYTVKYSKGCKNVGQYTVTVTFIGKFSGTKKLTYKIVPVGTEITSISAGKKSFGVMWDRQPEQITGYMIRYSTSSKMKDAKKLTVAKNMTFKEVSKLRSGKKYYVGVRTYKAVKIDGKSVKLYSPWSETVSIKTK